MSQHNSDLNPRDIATLALVQHGNLSGARMAEFLNVGKGPQYYRLRRLIKEGFINQTLPGKKCTYTLTDAGYKIARNYRVWFDPFKVGRIECVE